jgi:hypothetical protein
MSQHGDDSRVGRFYSFSNNNKHLFFLHSWIIARAIARVVHATIFSHHDCLVSKCRIPTAAVAQRGLFRILLGSGVTDIQSKNMEWPDEFYNNYEEPAQTVESGEPSGPPFTNSGADTGVSPDEYAAWFS